MKNILKGLLTTLIGLVVLFITIKGIYNGTTEWVWNGIAGIVIGVILIFSRPTLFEEKLSEFLSKFNK